MHKKDDTLVICFSGSSTEVSNKHHTGFGLGSTECRRSNRLKFVFRLFPSLDVGLAAPYIKAKLDLFTWIVQPPSSAPYNLKRSLIEPFGLTCNASPPNVAVVLLNSYACMLWQLPQSILASPLTRRKAYELPAAAYNLSVARCYSTTAFSSPGTNAQPPQATTGRRTLLFAVALLSCP